jgi:hypothetical protein
MKQKYPTAPVVPLTLNAPVLGSTPIAIYTGTGTTDIIMSTVNNAVAGVVFGPNASMPVATDDNSFPVSSKWVRVTLSPASRFLSVVSLDGVAVTLYYYFPGQTEV